MDPGCGKSLPGAARRRIPGGLPAIAVAWLLGNLCVQALPDLPGTPLTATLVLAAALAFVFPAVRRIGHTIGLPGRLATALAFACPAVRLAGWAIVGFLWTSFHADARIGERLPAALGGRDFEVTGWVDAFASASEARAVFSFRVDRDSDEQVPERLRLTWYDAPSDLAAGRDYALVVRLRAPRGLANPGAFDYERWLMLEDYGATGYVRSGGPVSRQHSFGQRWLIRRHELANRIAAASPSPGAAALITALAIGEREGFNDSHWEWLRRTGTSHLVAISGMHIGLVAAFVFAVARLIWLRLPQTLARFDLEAAAAASAVAAFAYAALAGFGLPTQRAVIMVAVALAMLVSRRTVGLFHGLAAALLAILAWDPLATLTASFWLSFGAVAALLALGSRGELVASLDGAGERSAGRLGLFMHVKETANTRFARQFRLFARVQWNITLALVPLSSLFFGEISLVSPLVNVLAIPFFSLVMVPLTLASTAALALGEAGQLLLNLTGHLADAAWAVLDWIARLPWAAVALPQPTTLAATLAVLAVFMGLAWHPLPGRRLAWLGLVPLAFGASSRPPQGSADVLVFDVGHGLAVLVETAEHRLLYDAGPVARSGFDAGREIVVPGLMLRDRRALDLLIVGHGDADHAGGAGAVLAAFPETEVLRGPDVDELPGRDVDERREPDGDGWQGDRVDASRGTICVSGQSWVWDEVRFDILHPPAGFDRLGNESSCVLKVSTQANSMLVTGDIESRAERLLADRAAHGADDGAAGNVDDWAPGADDTTAGTDALARGTHAMAQGTDAAAPRADVVIVPHHGSATSSSARFVAAVGASTAIVSAGHANRWGFPKPEVRQRWEAAGARVVVTGDSGAVAFRLGAGSVHLHSDRVASRRYWRASTAPQPGDTP